MSSVELNHGPPPDLQQKKETAYLHARNLVKRFKHTIALDEVSISVHEGEFICFLGPSGCGKTTLLRILSGLEVQDSGTIEQAGVDISALPPTKRDFGIVFQSYALFPNLSVSDNIAYGLSAKKGDRKAKERRVQELLTLVGLPDKGPSYPRQLSGGEQQRVAIARALAISPGLLLLDEPLSALDAQVRLRLRQEIRELQKRIGVTTIHVTHDQDEALAIADRIVLFRAGRIEQIGSPVELYQRPANPFVASFIGSMNFFDTSVVSGNSVLLGDIQIYLGSRYSKLTAGSTATLCIRPEDVILRRPPAGGENQVVAEVTKLQFAGSYVRVALKPRALRDSADFCIEAHIHPSHLADLNIRIAETLIAEFPRSRLHCFSSRPES